MEAEFGIQPASWRELMAALFRLELPKTLTEKIFSVPTEKKSCCKVFIEQKEMLVLQKSELQPKHN